MHIESDGDVLMLRWADSTTSFPLTPLSPTEFLDRSSFGVVRFRDGALTWVQNGEETQAPREKP